MMQERIENFPRYIYIYQLRVILYITYKYIQYTQYKCNIEEANLEIIQENT